ncbi:MAG: SUKH-4 family immunity protein [Oscillospiraceae bacterium]|nr:SUKH-4 family immunity protein [Oscillospiraceae bacterium]
MYYKEIRVWVPDEEVLNIRFLKHEKFFVYNFLNKPYIITAKISDTKNFIGFGIDGNIYLLDREKNSEIYVSSALAVFGRQLKLYRDLTAPRDRDDENSLKLEDFKKQIRELDNNAFLNENNFWSEVLRRSELDDFIYEVKKW